ncbi:rap1 GTPase-activating protein 2 [Amia ocellicauda]|uniref:rap1 GTPase-activating protein 2 n=1 Tax=Amia ocellicauda TaxID=2972642 RepID=UPI003464CCD2
MEGGNPKDTFFSRKRSFTFGAYGGVDKFSCNEVSCRPDTAGHSLTDILDSPPSSSPPLASTMTQRAADLFEIIAKLQGSRLDEQRCEFPPPLKVLSFLTLGGALPLILPPKSGGYWIDPPLRCEGGEPKDPPSPQAVVQPGADGIMDRDSSAALYRENFIHTYHHSFTAVDSSLGSLVLSVRMEGEESVRVILRMKEGSLHDVIPLSLFPEFPSAVQLAKMLCDSVTVSRFEPVSYPKAPQLISAFDEHRLSDTFKFGVLLQRDGQLTEEEILGNCEETKDFLDFLSILGENVNLAGFTGFRGGLDVTHGQTGSESVFTTFRGKQLMFHVATKLPFTEGDCQQLQRKRHIGNDIVSLVYQAGHTPFLPDIISSHFLHTFIVVRRVEGEREGAYQVSITAREDVPPFGPTLPDPPIFTELSQFREFLLTKLINAEVSCYRAQRFQRLEVRTRCSLLEALRSELDARSQCMLGAAPLATPPSEREGGGGGFIENFKRAIRVRSHSFDNLGSPRKTAGAASPQKHRGAQTPVSSVAVEKEVGSETSNQQPGASESPPSESSSSGLGEVKGQVAPGEEV